MWPTEPPCHGDANSWLTIDCAATAAAAGADDPHSVMLGTDVDTTPCLEASTKENPRAALRMLRDELAGLSVQVAADLRHHEHGCYMLGRSRPVGCSALQANHPISRSTSPVSMASPGFAAFFAARRSQHAVSTVRSANCPSRAQLPAEPLPSHGGSQPHALSAVLARLQPVRPAPLVLHQRRAALDAITPPCSHNAHQQSCGMGNCPCVRAFWAAQQNAHLLPPVKSPLSGFSEPEPLSSSAPKADGLRDHPAEPGPRGGPPGCKAAAAAEAAAPDNQADQSVPPSTEHGMLAPLEPPHDRLAPLLHQLAASQLQLHQQGPPYMPEQLEQLSSMLARLVAWATPAHEPALRTALEQQAVLLTAHQRYVLASSSGGGGGSGRPAAAAAAAGAHWSQTTSAHPATDTRSHTAAQSGGEHGSDLTQQQLAQVRAVVEDISNDNSCDYGGGRRSTRSSAVPLLNFMLAPQSAVAELHSSPAQVIATAQVRQMRQAGRCGAVLTHTMRLTCTTAA